MKVLNLYAGIGGNRKLWDNVEVTAVEYRKDIGDIYKKYYPEDQVLITDAHRYLVENYYKYDFIWSSRPCKTHSRANTQIVYPDMGLYQEIILLKHHFKGKWVVENVKPYYEPLIKPTIEIGRHLIWSNFKIRTIKVKNEISIDKITTASTRYGFNLVNEIITERKDQILRNLVDPEIGLHILNEAREIKITKQFNQISIFDI